MILKKYKILTLILCILTVISCSACEFDSSFLFPEETTSESEVTGDVTTGGAESGDNVTNSPSDVIVIPNPDIKKDFKNPFTGIATDVDSKEERAVAFVIDNNYLSFPQSGLSKIEVLCEFVRNDGTTALLAISKDPRNANLVGPLGVASSAMLDFVASFDAITFARSASEALKAELSSSPKDFFAYEINKTPFGFFESSERRSEYGYAYSVMGEGVRLHKAALSAGIRPKSDVLFASPFTIYAGEEAYVPSGGISNNVYIPASDSQKIQLVYSETTGEYYRYAFGLKQHVDALSKEALSFKNLFILEATPEDTTETTEPPVILPPQETNTPGETVPSVDEPELPIDPEETNAFLGNTGKGYFITSGRFIEIKWERTDGGSFKFFNASGVPLEIPEGNTYMSVLNPEQFSKIELNKR